ncbi:MAG: multi-sensor signal transduction histidine kinase [Ignavibacteria bacterium]|nr:MAG: multi-sensor signal transduction histidine kinase [Ignavibacteria bacterium]KAF0159007.1 MAG: multi-sensor signal transduction histidine kinase [Ignavibacteria bacterium]
MINLFTTTLRSKILLGFTVILLIMFLATLWSIYNFYRFNEYIKQTMQENYSVIIYSDNMGKTLDEQVEAVIIMFNQDFARGDSLFTLSTREFFYWHLKARDLNLSSEEKKILDEMYSELTSFRREYIDKLDYKIFLRGEAPKVKVDLGNLITQLQKIKGKCNRILELNHYSLENSVQNVKAITQTAAITILFILLGAIFISFVFGTKFSNYIVRPITKLRRSVSYIAEGNFSERIELDENSDEINNLADEFNKMSERLERYEQMNLNKILYEKRKSELLIEGINEPILMVDENFKVLLSNRSFNEVFGEKAVKNLEIKKILRQERTKARNKNQNDLPAKKEEFIRIKDSEGNQKYFNVIAASLDIPESETQGTVFVFNDVTKYQELDRMKSEFIAKVSHELKTPLTSMGMALGLFEDGVVGSVNEKQQDLIVSMKEDYDRLNKLVYEILELTKLEANIGKIKFETFEAVKLAEHVNKKFSIQAKEKNIKLEIIDKNSGCKINGNINSMMSAVENLVSNSLRFTPNGGEIKVEFLKKEDDLFIEISDTGIGISPANLKKVFDKFIQIDDSAPGSLGLGLSIAKEIIEIHGGEIKAFSELGKGSIFQIKLPVV